MHIIGMSATADPKPRWWQQGIHLYEGLLSSKAACITLRNLGACGIRAELQALPALIGKPFEELQEGMCNATQDATQ